MDKHSNIGVQSKTDADARRLFERLKSDQTLNKPPYERPPESPEYLKAFDQWVHLITALDLASKRLR